MKSYSMEIAEEEMNAYAFARLEGVDSSYKDLSEVCGRIRGKKPEWAEAFLKRVSEGEIPVLYKRHNKGVGHRHELGGAKGRYPKKAARIILGVLKSAVANAKVKNIGDGLVIVHVSANKKETYPRIAPKGRRSRTYIEMARIEIILKGKPSAVAKVEKTPEKKSTETAQQAEKKLEAGVKKDIVAKEEAKKEKIEDKKVESNVTHDHYKEKRAMKPRQQKGVM